MKFWQFVKNKLGRLATALGGLVALADIDISPMREPLESIFTHKGVQIITVVLFIASFLRHQYVSSLHPTESRAS